MAAAHRRNRAAAVAVFVGIGLAGAPHAQASGWAVTAASGRVGLAQSIDLQPPSTVTAVCPAPQTDRTIAVSWSSASYATSYVVYRSTTSSTDGFAPIATGVTATTYTDSGLKKATYWYAVATVVGTPTWTSAMSGPTAAHVIGTAPRCL